MIKVITLLLVSLLAVSCDTQHLVENDEQTKVIQKQRAATLTSDTQKSDEINPMQWERYHSDAYGFEIHYPNNFQVVSQSKESFIITSKTKNDLDGILILVDPTPINNLDALYYYAQEDPENPDDYIIRRVKFNNYDAISSQLNDGEAVGLRFIYLFHNDAVVRLRSNSLPEDQNIKQINQILSTFIFLR